MKTLISYYITVGYCKIGGNYDTLNEAERVVNEYLNRNKNDGYDEYWKNEKYIIVKEITIFDEIKFYN